MITGGKRIIRVLEVNFKLTRFRLRNNGICGQALFAGGFDDLSKKLCVFIQFIE